MRAYVLLNYVAVIGIMQTSRAQYQQTQYRAGAQIGTFHQQQAGYQAGGSQRYQQSHVIVGPGPVVPNNFGGQFKEQRTINIQENIQGTAQQAGYGYGAASMTQYGQYGAMGGYGGIQGTSGRSVADLLKGAQVDLRLTSYTNSGLRLPNDTTCNCPISNCNFVPSNQQNQCQFSFVIVISCADQSIQYVQSNFYPVPPNGVMTTGNWTNQYTFLMNTKPVSIDVFVQHLGVVIAQTTGQLLFFNHLSLVDSFVVDMSTFNENNLPQQQTLTLTGQLLQSQLQMNLNVQCINNMMGPLCDLTCNATNAQPNRLVICYSNRTETFSACKWNNYRNQGVAYAFRTWTIVLACLLGIALLLILCLILSYIICFSILNRRTAEEKESTYVRESYENDNYDSHTATTRKIDTNYKGEYGSDKPLIENVEYTSTIASRKPVGILAKNRVEETVPIHIQDRSSRQNSTVDYTRQQDSPSTEDSYLANGQVQQTTTTTTTTTRREQIV
ncbi:unnamed protein product [Caenorhabditis bovis]|uniref:Phlebovirus glycoprotein G2 fusion domain-containing protein n=1 Tax=Caenorhabditis bovis TaxID=2654633 RepID=A0A8S1EI49_9PELO|nr:unnamed protein product [Caenorhabditis bovis]